MTDVFTTWQKQAKPVTSEVQVCFDRDLVKRLEDSQRELKKKTEKGMLEGPPSELVQEVDDLTTQVVEQTHALVFQNIGYTAWERLRAQHPPREEDTKDRRDHNGETFPPAATAASCVTPGMTLEQATWFYQTMPASVCVRVWAAVLEVNLEVGDEKKVIATAATTSTASK